MGTVVIQIASLPWTLRHHPSNAQTINKAAARPTAMTAAHDRQCTLYYGSAQALAGWDDSYGLPHCRKLPEADGGACRPHSELGAAPQTVPASVSFLFILGELPCIRLVTCGPVSCSDELLSLCQLVVFWRAAILFWPRSRTQCGGAVMGNAWGNDEPSPPATDTKAFQKAVSPGYPSRGHRA